MEFIIEQAELGTIDIAYGDESHFGRQSNLPYAWQPIGSYIPMESFHEKRFSVTGFLSKYFLHHWINEGTNTAETFAQYLREFGDSIERKTVLILDNASIHRSKIIKELRPELEKEGLFLFFLPPYSPHLNKIEMVWRTIKRNISIFYRKSYQTFKDRVSFLLENYIGSYYEITSV